MSFNGRPRINLAVLISITFLDEFGTMISLAGNDLIEGFLDADVLYGGKGSDTILRGQGSGQLFGQSGNDYPLGDSRFG